MCICTYIHAYFQFDPIIISDNVNTLYMNVILQYVYQQPFVAIPSQVCVGDAVPLRCEIILTVGNTSQLRAATIN